MKKIHILLLLFGATLSRTSAQTESEIGGILTASYSSVITQGNLFPSGHTVLGFNTKESGMWLGIGVNVGGERAPYDNCGCYVPPPVWRNQNAFGIIGYHNEQLRIGIGPGVSITNHLNYGSVTWSGNGYFDYRGPVWLSGIGSVNIDLDKVLKVDLSVPLNPNSEKAYVALGVEGMYLSDHNYEVVGTLSGYLRVGFIPKAGDMSVAVGASFIRATPHTPGLFLKFNFMLDSRFNKEE